jgi:hypothetical protein
LALDSCLILKEDSKAMKKIVRSIALALASLLTLIGIQKAKEPVRVSEKKSRVARQRVVLLDEHEMAAFNSN